MVELAIDDPDSELLLSEADMLEFADAYFRMV